MYRLFTILSTRSQEEPHLTLILHYANVILAYLTEKQQAVLVGQ
jgi:hypothetical protein